MSEPEVLHVLRSFFDAMGKWEADSKALYRKGKQGEREFDDAKRRVLSNLKQVFAMYCTASDSPARAKYGAPHVSLIPTYGADLEKVQSVEISGNRAKVLRKQTTGPKFLLRYNLKKTDRGWRIEDDRKIVKPDGTEEEWDL